MLSVDDAISDDSLDLIVTTVNGNVNLFETGGSWTAEVMRIHDFLRFITRARTIYTFRSKDRNRRCHEQTCWHYYMYGQST